MYQYTEEQVKSIGEAHVANILKNPPGNMDLTSSDKKALENLLAMNKGSKDNIKGIRKWMLDR